jgi:hypothetical protein
MLKIDVMNDLYTLGYRDEGPFFLSNFGQITRATRIHGVHNEEAIDRNTEAIIAQTEMQHSESDESQVQFSGHSMMLERESNETQDIMTAHTKMMKDESDESQSLFKSESDETQEILRDQASSIQRAITSHTKTMKDESDETQQLLDTELDSILAKLEAIANKIELNTAGDVTNSNNITRAIQNLRLIVNP